MNRILPNLNPLRFFLALLVVLFHVPKFAENRGVPFYYDAAFFQKGTEAVYLFFSLSGFLIIRNLYDERVNKGKIVLKNFYMRRILRIFPLYYLVFIVGLLYYQFILPHLGYDFKSDYPLFNAIALGIFFLPNILAAIYHPGGILEILWSIGIEEQFYLFIAPLFLWFKNIRKILIVFSILYGFVFFSNIFPFLQAFSMVFFFFTISGLISILSDKIILPKFVKYLLSILLILYFTTNWFVFRNDIVYDLYSSILFAFFLHSISVKPLFIIRNRQLNYLGKISYGIYMYHAIAIQIVFFFILKIHFNSFPSPAIYIFTYLLSVIFLTLLLAGFSYEYYEKYFLKLKNNFR
ncbi:Peptidoglycan/LPS O-acetylase OafA/YrhL, contains acyltransferase and SGNH-hydrolase domains [Halpernia humi]|uniref:Peptidoglycan/LPS O-acetylase OafA/YrhL, contains acyltransferase and SGNH-hydrolase domains n=1 Tax=Halpernia humi TaxID=493375 RepID=A0A1H6ALF1_9FLAO|nr:acyltransferase [Halpernia humi]SEG49050.1 Peptidoglycan/LPS O-acetylase OafA/YrhL, contains acyltransferase and SGNH-hydrolase domains [Halpernia humi]